MCEQKIVPNAITYSSSVSACERDAAWDLALGVLDLMRGAGIEVDVVICSSAISALSEGHQWQAALFEFSLLRERRALPDLVAYGAALGACVRAPEERWPAVLDLLRQMREGTVRQDEISCGAGIAACGNALQWQLAVWLLARMPARYRVEPNSVVFSSALLACLRSNRWQVAFELLDLQDSGDVAVDTASHSALLSEAELRRMSGREVPMLLRAMRSAPRALREDPGLDAAVELHLSP